MSERVKPDGQLWDLYDGRSAPWAVDLDENWFLRSTILRVIEEEIDRWEDARNAATIRGHEHTAREAAVIWRAFVRFRRRFKEADDE